MPIELPDLAVNMFAYKCEKTWESLLFAYPIVLAFALP